MLKLLNTCAVWTRLPSLVFPLSWMLNDMDKVFSLHVCGKNGVKRSLSFFLSCVNENKEFSQRFSAYSYFASDSQEWAYFGLQNSYWKYSTRGRNNKDIGCGNYFCLSKIIFKPVDTSDTDLTADMWWDSGWISNLVSNHRCVSAFQG